MTEEKGFLDRLFKLQENGTTVKIEFLAGITTFMTMAYILAVNPIILSAAGMDKGGCPYGNGPGLLLGNYLYGRFCQLSFRLGTRYGLKRIFCLYRRVTNGIFVGNGFVRRFC